jgi:hypothetical protein
MPDHGFRGDYWRIKPNRIRGFCNVCFPEVPPGKRPGSRSGFPGDYAGEGRFPALSAALEPSRGRR